MCLHPPARGVRERSRRHSEGDCHSRAFLSKTSCSSGATFLPPRPSPCLVRRDGHCWTWRHGGPLCRLSVGGCVGCWPSQAEPPLPRPVSLQPSAVSRAVSQGQVNGVLGSPELPIYPHRGARPVSAPTHCAFGPATGWFRCLLSGLR